MYNLTANLFGFQKSVNSFWRFGDFSWYYIVVSNYTDSDHDQSQPVIG